MRTIPSGLLALMTSGETTLAWGLKVTRTDATVFGWTSAQRDATIGGVDYVAAPGLDVASLVSTAGLAVDNAELTVLDDGTILTRADVLAGRWDGAAWELFQYDWATPTERDVRKRGTFGTVQPRPGGYTIELRSLRQALQQAIGGVTQPTCRWRLGDARCGKVLTAFVVTGTVTGVTDARRFTDTARTEAADWYANGQITWTSGDKDGLSALVRASTSAGLITLVLPSIYAIQVGDTYSMVAGCRKRRTEDCDGKFDNVLRFGGQPDLPGRDAVLAPASFED